MPIDYKKYHPRWTLIRRLILKRARHRCEGCGIANYTLRLAEGITACFDTHKQAAQVREVYNSSTTTFKSTVVVLTISHTNHNIKDNKFTNLKCLCQKCHNAHDQEYRKANRKQTILDKNTDENQIEMKF